MSRMEGNKVRKDAECSEKESEKFVADALQVVSRKLRVKHRRKGLERPVKGQMGIIGG